MDYWPEAVCPECHKVFHPLLQGQVYCLPCTLFLGRKHADLMQEHLLTPCTGLPIKKVMRRRNEELHRRQAIARQYVDMVQKPFEAFTAWHKTLHDMQEFLQKVPDGTLSEEKAAMQSSIDTCAQSLHQDLKGAMDALLSSSEAFESSVEEYAQGLPSCVTGKDRVDISLLLDNLFTEEDKKEVDKDEKQ